MTDDLRSAVERARRGDRQAFSKLVRHYQRRVYLTAYRMMGNHQDADDVAQEAFVRAFKGLPRFDQRADIFTWLYRIVVNVALNHLRQRQRRPTQSIEDYRLAPSLEQRAGGDPRRVLEFKRMAQEIAAALDELSDTLRATLVLVVFDGVSYRNAAEILECSEGTVAWRIHEARRVLRRRLGHYLSGDEAMAEEGTAEEAKGAADVR